jgi:hypothetical protein
MLSDLSFYSWRYAGLDYITELAPLSLSAQSSGLPLAQVVSDSAFGLLTEQTPRLKASAWDNCDIRKGFVGILRSVTSALSPDKPDDLATLLEASLYDR